MLFDSHAHLDEEKFAADRAAVIQRAAAAGVAGIINPGSDPTSSRQSIELAARYPMIYAAVGIHPEESAAVGEADYEQLTAMVDHPRVVAVGEIGLDYHYDFSPRTKQRAVFIRQLDLARQTGLPVIIHDREAHGDTLDIIRREGRGLTGVFHCFSGSLEMAREVWQRGFYLSVGGAVTFKNAAKLPAIVKAIPRDRLLLETDSPYMAPHPYRGRRNEPSYVKVVAEFVAGLLGLEPAELAAVTTANTCRLFKIELAANSGKI